MDIVSTLRSTKSKSTVGRPVSPAGVRSVFGLKAIKSATNVPEAPRAHNEVVKPNGHIRALMFATPKQPREEQCPLL